MVAKAQYRNDKYALQEGLISHLWQYWCIFCRDVVMSSAKGAMTSAGLSTTSAHAALSELEMAYVATKFSRNEKVGNIVGLAGQHLEPTWGDVSKLNRILTGMAPSNAQTLLMAFGLANTISDLQLCRNTCAHMNRENVSKVNAARVRYSQTGFSHPSEVMFWVVPASKDFAWRTWVEEMEIIAGLAVG